MTHEIKQLFNTLRLWQKQGKKAVFISVVAVKGSSYRKPGVRMIISEKGESVGAVSGGCIEKEILRQAKSVFQSGRAKIMTYDGRLRIGCEGIIHILIEPVFLGEELLIIFDEKLESRQAFQMESRYYKELGEYSSAGSVLILNEKKYSITPSFKVKREAEMECFVQTFDPLFQLYIFGAEHDAVQLSQAAKLLGWEVTIVASADESKSCDYFPGASALITPSFNNIDISAFDEQTAVVLMTHSFNKDVQYLLALKNSKPAYMGIIGPVKRRERVLSSLLDFDPEISHEFIERINGPAGINIGAESASEIAISIIAEILSTIRKQVPMALKDKTTGIHE